MKPKEGHNNYRVLVPTNDRIEKNNGQWWIDVGVHWIKASKNGKTLAVVGDPAITFGEPSRINSAIERAIATAPDSTCKKLYESWRARSSIWFNIINRDDNHKVEILELSKRIFAQVLDLIEMYDDRDQDITDPVNGVDIVITRVGKGIDTKNTVPVKTGISKPATPDQMIECHDSISSVKRQYFNNKENAAFLAISNLSGIALSRSESEIFTITNNTNNVLKSPSSIVDDATILAGEDTELLAMRARVNNKNRKQRDYPSGNANGNVEVITEIDDNSELTANEADDILAELNSLNN